MAIEIELDRVDLSQIRKDPLISQPEREEYLWGLLSHIVSTERLEGKLQLKQNQGLEPLEVTYLRARLYAMDRAWLFAKSFRVVHYALDILPESDTERQALFAEYVGERFADAEIASNQLDLLQQRFADLKNPPTPLPTKEESIPLTPLTAQARSLVTPETLPITFVMAGLSRVNRGVKPIGDARELTQVLLPDPNFDGLKSQHLWQELQKIEGMKEEDLERLARVEEGRLTGWYITSLDRNWQILFQKEGGRLTFRVSRKQS